MFVPFLLIPFLRVLSLLLPPPLFRRRIQLRDVLIERSGTLEGVDPEFADGVAKGLDIWVSAANRNLLRYGIMVLRKN